MYATRRTILYSSFIVVMALFLSLGLLQLTQSTVQSAPQAPIQIGQTTVTISKSVEGALPTTPWEFTIEGGAVISTVYVDPTIGFTTVVLPWDNYTVTEVAKDGYGLTYRDCVTSSIPAGAARRGVLPPEMYSTTVNVTLADTAECTFWNIELPSLTIIKDAIPDSPQPFHYHVEVAAFGASTGEVNAQLIPLPNVIPITLTDDGTGISNTVTLNNLEPYPYLIYETPVDGWLVESVQCEGYTPPQQETFAAASVDPASAVASDAIAGPFFLQSGDAVTCTVTNIAPAITVTKTVGTDPATCATEGAIDVFSGTEVYFCYEVENTGGVTLTTHSLTDDVLGDLLTDFAYDLFPGASVDSVTAGLVVTSAPTVDVTNVATWTGVYTQEIVLGEEITTVITLTDVAEAVAQVNVYEPSRIIIDKVTDPAGSDVEFAFEWGELEGTPEGFSLSDTDEPFVTPDLFPGSYAVSEEVPADWNLVDVTCQDATGATYLPNAIELGEGVEVTCTFTNEEDIPTGLDETPMPNMDIEQFLPWMGATQ